MLRRRLRLSYSSSEEEEEEIIRQLPPEGDGGDDIDVQVLDSTASLHTVTLASPASTSTPNPNPNPNPNPGDPPRIDISDDEPVELADHGSAPEPSPNPNHSFASMPSSGASSLDGPGCPISRFLRRLGLSLRREWLESCMLGLESSGYASLDVAGKAKLCFERFLFSDMNFSGGGALPENVASMHLVDLAGPFVLQVDEIVNISCPLRGRYQSAPCGVKRCLKLSMTDGVQRVFGMEYRPIKDLEVLAPAGMKIVICNVHVRHGLLMLVPEALEVLGGLVDELNAARQRLLHEVNKPPRGKRTRNGLLPPLATRATHAAWPMEDGSVLGNSNNSTLQGTAPFQEDLQDAAVAASVADTNSTEVFEHPISRENAENDQSHPAAVEDIHMIDEAEHPFMLSGDREIPFTYLACLSAKWAALKEEAPLVKGTIKCFLTGVKGFQYKQRTTFELRVYVDDGSLISEILIDHNVVQKGIGYSPEEVTAALASSDKKVVSHMRETLKQFQIFLVNFEGTMLLEMTGTSPVPVAVEMNQSCPSSIVWLLLRRLQSSTASEMVHDQQVEAIDISP